MHVLGIAKGQTDDLSKTPADLVDVKQIAVGFGHAVALLNNGTVRAWGYTLTGAGKVPSLDLPPATTTKPNAATKAGTSFAVAALALIIAFLGA